MRTRTFAWFIAIVALLLLALIAASERGEGGFGDWLASTIHGPRGGQR